MSQQKIQPVSPPLKESDELAIKEKNALNKGRDIDKERAEQDFDLKQGTKRLLAHAIRILIVVLGLALTSGIFVWAIHLLVPESYRWLSDEEINELQRLMTSALLGMVASEYAGRLFR